MVAPTQLPGRAFQSVNRVSDLLFHWRASDLSLKPVGSDTAGTFARASAGGLVQGTGLRHHLDPDNQLRLVGPAPDQLERWEWVQNASGVYVPALRLEGARTDGWTFSEDLSDVAWTKSSATVSADVTLAPDGNLTADKIVEMAVTVANHGVSRLVSPATSVDTDTTFSAYFKADGQTFVKIQTTNRDAAAWASWVNLTTCAAGTTNANHTIVVTDAGNGWCRVKLTFDSGSAGAGVTVAAYTAPTDNSGSFLGDITKGVYAWGLQIETDKPFASTYIPTVGSTVTRAAESLFWTYNALPQPMTVYAKFRLGGLEANQQIVSVGKGSNNAVIQIRSTSTTALLLEYTDADQSPVRSVAFSGAVAAGDVIEVAGQLTASGQITALQSINSGAVSTSAQQAALTLPTIWGESKVYLGMRDNGQNSFASHMAVKIAAGVRTLDYMRGAF